jgi:hypothetical protein
MNENKIFYYQTNDYQNEEQDVNSAFNLMMSPISANPNYKYEIKSNMS